MRGCAGVLTHLAVANDYRTVVQMERVRMQMGLQIDEGGSAVKNRTPKS